MFSLFLKIFKTPDNVVFLSNNEINQKAVLTTLKELESKIKKLFHGSLAIRQIDSGSDNATEQELVALSNSFYDVERFGIHFVASPRHADMLLITGPMTRNMIKAVKRTYEATPSPKVVVTVGDDAENGGIWQGSYAVSDGVSNILPVHYHIPGDPPSPTVILSSLLKILQIVESKTLKS